MRRWKEAAHEQLKTTVHHEAAAVSPANRGMLLAAAVDLLEGPVWPLRMRSGHRQRKRAVSEGAAAP